MEYCENRLTYQDYVSLRNAVDNKDFLTQLFNAMYDELPIPKKKKV